MDLPTPETVMAVIKRHRAALGLDEIEHIHVALIGQGEANLNLLVTVNQAHPFNLRIGLRAQESDRTLQNEFEVLQLVPRGVGPQAFAVDCSRTLLRQPYLLLEYVVGELKQDWQLQDLQAYARTLAHLHQRKFDQHGAVGQMSNAPYDFLYRFDVALHYWQTHHPYLLDIPMVQRLLPPIRHLIATRAGLFTELRHFAVVHGDAHPLNILFNDAGQVCLIDWEQATIGDPACDVAMVGWEIANLALNPDATLRARREVWMVYTMCFDQMYHRTQIPTDSTGKQAATVQRIETYLAQRFLNDS